MGSGFNDVQDQSKAQHSAVVNQLEEHTGDFTEIKAMLRRIEAQNIEDSARMVRVEATGNGLMECELKKARMASQMRAQAEAKAAEAEAKADQERLEAQRRQNKSMAARTKRALLGFKG